ncbi:hypothetical protein [Acetobacter nitrogenifigens]|nr:hypothetical protein [Acetobacter nitrogenifigens]
MARDEKSVRRGNVAQSVIRPPERTDEAIDQGCIAPPFQQREIGEVQIPLPRVLLWPSETLMLLSSLVWLVLAVRYVSK